MSAPFKPFPFKAASLPSAQEYQAFCRQRLPEFDLSKVQVVKSSHLLFDDAEGKHFCTAQVDASSREMKLWFGRYEPGKAVVREQQFVEMRDACALGSQLWGSAEFIGDECQDGFWDPRLKTAEPFRSFRYFQNQCESMLRLVHAKSDNSGNAPQISAERVRLVTEEKIRDDQYSLLYQHRGLDFFCRADILNLQGGHLGISYGKLEALREASYDENLGLSRMTDACSMTRTLAGESKMASPHCADHDPYRQSVERQLEAGAHAMGTGLFYFTLFSLGWRALGYGTRTLASRLAPSAGPLASRVFPVGAPGGFNPRILARAGVAATLGVMALDRTFERGVVASNYRKSVNERVTQQVYEAQGLYDYSGWKKLNPLSWLNKSRRLFRAIAPNAIHWAVARSYPELVQAIMKKDSEASRQAEAWLGQVLPVFLQKDAASQRRVLEFLKTPARFEGDAETKRFLEKVREAVKALVKVDPLQNSWAAKIFTPEGLLQPGQEAAFLRYFGPIPR